MSKILIYFFIGISLSIDAFSLSLALGTIIKKKQRIILFPIIVGIFHFIMTSTGNKIGYLLSEIAKLPLKKISGIIFIYLAIETYQNKNKSEEIKVFSLFKQICVAFLVSIDSILVGLAYGVKREKIILAAIIFLVESSFFTYLGIKIGDKIQKNIDNYSTYFGTIILLLIGGYYLFWLFTTINN